MILTYREALDIMQKRLKEFKHSQLKSFCTEHNLNYVTVSGLKTNNVKKELPHLVLKVLFALGYKYEVNYESFYIFNIPPNANDSLVKDIKRTSKHQLIKNYKNSETAQ